MYCMNFFLCQVLTGILYFGKHCRIILFQYLPLGRFFPVSPLVSQVSRWSQILFLKHVYQYIYCIYKYLLNMHAND